jgi:hypothetical protein
VFTGRSGVRSCRSYRSYRSSEGFAGWARWGFCHAAELNQVQDDVVLQLTPDFPPGWRSGRRFSLGRQRIQRTRAETLQLLTPEFYLSNSSSLRPIQPNRAHPARRSELLQLLTPEFTANTTSSLHTSYAYDPAPVMPSSRRRALRSVATRAS